MRFYLDHPEELDCPALEALGEGPRWNGWRTPIVTLEQMQAFIAAWRAVDPNGVWGECYVEDGYLVCTRSDNDDPDEWDRWPSLDGNQFKIDGWVFYGEDDLA